MLHIFWADLLKVLNDFIKKSMGKQGKIGNRAALDAALDLGIPCGGWCPKGRKAEDGPIPEQYPIQETDSTSYPVRTEMNVRDSDSTLILTWRRPTGGKVSTISLAKKHKKPCLAIDQKEPGDHHH
jgi:hypothetical protein